MSKTSFVAAALLLLLLGTAMRFAWLRSDPPVAGSVGIVWHDEGAWVHNARNRALWGTWRTDEWNPVFIAPVFTALEYATFETLGVGTWQARVVPAISGLVAVIFLTAGLSAVAGRRAALVGATLLTVNYAFVMWNRAALMESTMTMWMVVAWGASALAERRPAWGLVAGAAGAAAWFTKASAAFFVAALAIAALAHLARRGRPAGERRWAVLTLAALAASFLAVAVAFILPNWSEYRFYNWQMTVTRKPEYTLGAFVDRATWIPIVQGIFSRMWLELVLGSAGLVAIVARWRVARPAERLLVLWMVIGLAELVVHDSGNERRYVMFIPAVIALAAWSLRGDSGTRQGSAGAAADATLAVPGGRWTLAAALGLMAFVVAGAALRLVFQEAVNAGDLKMPVRLAAAIGVVAALGIAGAGARLPIGRLGTRVPGGLAWAFLLVAVAVQGWQYASWAGRRAEHNYRAAVALGQELPPGTLVQGKLANGLSLENRIKPLFVGNGFGNYEDRLRRDDARYILTYDLPRVGYESSDGSGLIQGILQHYPRHRIVDSFVVDETPLPDRAVLIEKVPDEQAGHARDQ